MLEGFSALQTSIETHPAIGDTLRVGSSASLQGYLALGYHNIQRATYGGILVKLVGGDEIGREDEFDVLRLCLLNERSDFLRTSLVKERVTDLCPSPQ